MNLLTRHEIQKAVSVGIRRYGKCLHGDTCDGDHLIPEIVAKIVAKILSIMEPDVTLDKSEPFFILHTIREDGTILWDGCCWRVSHDSGFLLKLTGKRFAFAIYPPEYKILHLWGTEEYYLHPDDQEACRENMALLTDKRGYINKFWWEH